MKCQKLPTSSVENSSFICRNRSVTDMHVVPLSRYAYSGEAADDDDEEAQSLTKGDGEVGMVKMDRDRNVGVSNAFSLEDEAEEDKRE